MPYFGDDDTAGVDVSVFDRLPDEIDPEVSSESEEFLIVYLINKCGGLHVAKRNVFPILNRILNASPSEIEKAYKRVMEGLMDRRNALLKIQYSSRKDREIIFDQNISTGSFRKTSFNEWQNSLENLRIEK